MKFSRVDFFPTNKCNLSCDFCHGPPKGKAQELGISLLEEVIRTFKVRFDVQTASVAGGEPTLYYAFSDLMLKLREEGIRTRLLTNGTTLNKHTQTLRLIDELVLPFDGYTPETFAQMRKKSRLFGKIVEFLETWYVPGQKLSVGIVISKVNIGHLDQILSRVDEINQLRIANQYSPVSARIFMFAAQSNGARWKDKFHIETTEFYEETKNLAKTERLSRWIDHCIDYESESYTCLMLYPNGDFYLPERDRFIVVTNVYKRNWVNELISYFSRNPAHYEKLIQSHEKNETRS